MYAQSMFELKLENSFFSPKYLSILQRACKVNVYLSVHTAFMYFSCTFSTCQVIFMYVYHYKTS